MGLYGNITYSDGVGGVNTKLWSLSRVKLGCIIIIVKSQEPVINDCINYGLIPTSFTFCNACTKFQGILVRSEEDTSTSVAEGRKVRIISSTPCWAKVFRRGDRHGLHSIHSTLHLLLSLHLARRSLPLSASVSLLSDQV